MAQDAYLKNPDMVYRKIANECILVPVRRHSVDLNAIYLLNEIASFIWELIGQRSLEEISQVLMQAYEVDAETLQNDLCLFLQQLIAIGALQEVKTDA